MKHARLWIRIGLLCGLLFITLAGATRQARRETSPLPPTQRRAFELPELLRGRPAPGGSYPWFRIDRRPPHNWPPATRPEGIDLDVTHISRTPAYNAYCVEYPDGVPILCPGSEDEQRWPAPGEVVTFTAHVVNQGTLPSPPAAYRWAFDGAETATGTLPPLEPGATTTISTRWTWAHAMAGERVLDDHTVAFTVDPGDRIAETYEANNHRQDLTNALALHIALTPAMAQAYAVPWDPAHPYSAEDWLQRHVAAMNAAFAASVYPTTPEGATPRVRIDRITVTPDPPLLDGTSDGAWFVAADYRLTSSAYDPETDIDWHFIHELGHQVGLIDLYNLDVTPTGVEVRDRSGDPLRIGFTWPRPGIMGGGDTAPYGDPRRYAAHTAAGFSTTAGYRRGYYGEYQYDLPRTVALRVLDNSGAPAPGVQVALYQRTGPPTLSNEPTLDDVPEITGTTGPDGRFVLPNRPVPAPASTRTGHVLRANPFGPIDLVGRENRFLIKLTAGDHEEFVWLDITPLNLAYWQGHTGTYDHVIDSHVPPAAAPPPPALTRVAVVGDQVTVCWDPVSDPTDPTAAPRYAVYRIAPPTYEARRVRNGVPGPCFIETTTDPHRLYAVTTLAGSESGFGEVVWVPRMAQPAAIALTPTGDRLILDPQNGQALLQQDAAGRYVGALGSPHDHLHATRFLAVGPDGHIVVSHPGDRYSDRHSVRILDAEGMPVREFGTRGTDLGQFDAPAGVAVWGRPCTIEAPLTPDAHTALLLTFDDTDTGAAIPTANAPSTVSHPLPRAEPPIRSDARATGDLTIVPGRHGDGARIEQGDALRLTGAVDPARGALELWLRPTWDPSDGRNHTLVEIGAGGFNRMRLVKDTDSTLRFIVWNEATSYEVTAPIAEWQPGDWHHVAATWQTGTLALTVDGRERDRREGVALPEFLPPAITVGATRWGEQPAAAVLDDLRISTIPRIGDSDTCSLRILVADSGNHRIQVFDTLGNVVTTFGSRGTGPNRLDTPQGLAIDGLGRILVADAGNDRVQMLAFDGATLTPIGTLAGSFESPTGVAPYGPDLILVADTGHGAIKLLNLAGRVLASYARPTDTDTGIFNGPSGVAATPDGTLLVADTGNRRIVTIRGTRRPRTLYLPTTLR